MPPRIKLDLFYDIGSPYSYFAFEVLLRYEKLWNMDLNIHPTLLGGIFKLTGNSSPMSQPCKARHMLNDVQRISGQFKVPISFPPDFPGNTLNVMRLLRLLKEELGRDDFVAATRHYYKENFVRNTPLSDPSFLTSLPESILSTKDLQSAIIRYRDPKISEMMKREAAHLVETYSTFGFPWMVVTKADGDEASFYGSDRFSNMSWWLGENDYPWSGPTPPQSKL